LASRHEPLREIVLDRCIDRLLAGEAWEPTLPADPVVREEVASLMEVAEDLQVLAGRATHLRPARKERIWHRVSSSRRGVIRRIAFYRLPYLPPLWIRPEAC
jgi:hypothetical protein